MKAISLICAMLIALMFPALATGQGEAKSKAPQASSVEQQLKQMEDDWTRANKNRDTTTLRRILAEDYFATDEKGKPLNREQFISQITSNPDVIESSDNFDMQARVYGNTAVLTGGIKEN